MREIKFRVWDNDEKRMIYDDIFSSGTWLYPDYILDNDIEGQTFVTKICGPLGEEWTEGKYPIMQYTGLKDKNNVDIYESDILAMDSEKGKVIYDEGSYVVIFQSGAVILLHRVIYDFHVKNVGNIYENPELLKEVQSNE